MGKNYNCFLNRIIKNNFDFKDCEIIKKYFFLHNLENTNNNHIGRYLNVEQEYWTSGKVPT